MNETEWIVRGQNGRRKVRLEHESQVLYYEKGHLKQQNTGLTTANFNIKKVKGQKFILPYKFMIKIQ